MTVMMRRPNPVLAKMESFLEQGDDLDAVELEMPKKGSLLRCGTSLESLPSRKSSQPTIPSLEAPPEESVYKDEDDEEETESTPKADFTRRWLGCPPEKMDDAFVQSKATDLDPSGQPLDISLRFLFLQSIPSVLAEGMGRNLVALNVSSNNLCSLHGLKNLPRLLELKAYACELTTLEGLEAPKLVKLDVSDNKLDNSAFLSLAKMRSLEVLNVDKNDIDSLEGVSTIQLKELYASTNKIKNLGTSLHRITSLETLHLDENLLGPSIQAFCFQDLVNLTELSLRQNLLRDISFMHVEKLPGQLGLIPSRENIAQRNLMIHCETLPALQYLYVQRNEINKVAITPCQNMLELNLENNLMEKITDEFVTSFPNLEVCYLAGNRFSTLADWSKLRDIKTVVEISVNDNPWLDGLSNGTRRSQILREIPRLQTVDEESVVAEGMEETIKAVSNPLMHCKSSSYRYYNESALNAWEARQMKTLNTIDCQIQKRLEEGDDALKSMTRYLIHADAVLKKEYELRSKEELDGEARGEAPLSSIADVGDWSYNACEKYNPPKQSKSSKLRRRLDQAKTFEAIEEEPSCPASPLNALEGLNDALVPILDPPLPLYTDEVPDLCVDNMGAIADDEDSCSDDDDNDDAEKKADDDDCSCHEYESSMMTQKKISVIMTEEDDSYAFDDDDLPEKGLPPLEELDNIINNFNNNDDDMMISKSDNDDEEDVVSVEDDEEVAYINARKSSMISTTTAATSCYTESWADAGTSARDHYRPASEMTETTTTTPMTKEEEPSMTSGTVSGRGSKQNYTTPDMDPRPLRIEARAKRKSARPARTRAKS